jgi:hypothetical protein
MRALLAVVAGFGLAALPLLLVPLLGRGDPGTPRTRRELEELLHRVERRFAETVAAGDFNCAEILATYAFAVADEHVTLDRARRRPPHDA